LVPVNRIGLMLRRKLIAIHLTCSPR
jgi:hypothetical protein